MTAANVTPPGDTYGGGATFSPGRFVDPCSRVAAKLRAAGLEATAIPRAVDGGSAEVDDAEAEAELARRGIVVKLPKPLPPPSEAEARAIVRVLQAAGIPTHKLRPGRKAPLESGWKNAQPLTEDENTQWLVDDGNLGTVPARCGENGMLWVDAENAAATKVFEAAGLVPLAYTAKAQHPLWPEKDGGSHLPVLIPRDVNPATLDNVRQSKLPGGGLVDFLFDTNCVLAGSRLDCAPGRRYKLNPAFHPEQLAAVDVRWLFDKTAPLPEVAPEFREALAALHGRAVKPVRTPRPFDPNADRITQEVDAIPASDWFAGYEDKVQITGVDGGCYCRVFGWYRANNPHRSGIIHEDCAFGSGVHIFSTSMREELSRDGFDCPEHMSRLDLRTYLEGRPGREGRSAVAAEFGISLSTPLGSVDLSGFTYRPADAEPPSAMASTSPVIGVNFRVPEDSTRHLKAVPRIGTVGGDQSTAVDSTAASTVEGTTAAPTTEELEDTGLKLFREIEEVDATGFWDSLPILRQIHRAAITNGVYPWGLLGAVMPRIACSIPPHVRLVGSAGKEGGRSGGASLNLSNILVGAPEAGKSETIKISTDLVALPSHAKCATSGTGEGIIKSFAYMKKASGKGDSFDPAPPDPAVVDPSHPGSTAAAPPVGSVGGQVATGANSYEMVHITDTVMLTDGEIASFTAEMHRQGTKLSSVLRSAWVGEELGSTTGEIERRTFLPAHSYRLGTVLGAQVTLDALGKIFDEGDVGTPQRFGFFPVKTIPAVGEPVSRINLPIIDWYDGQAAAAQAAQLTGTLAPVWIHRPNAAHREIEDRKEMREANAHLVFSTADARRRADDEDSIDDKRGHELLHQLKIAAVLAVGDGHREPTDAHWHAAGQIMYVRELMVKVVTMVLNVHRENADRRLGRSRGVMQAAAKAAEAGETQTALQSVCDTIMRLVDAAADPDSNPEYRDQVAAAKAGGKVKPKGRTWANGGVNTSYLTSWITGTKRGLIEPALRELRRGGFITSGHIIHRVPAAPAAPAS